MTAFRLAHISDPHLPPPPLPFRSGDLASKRLLSRFAWRRKRRRHLRPVLDAIIADVRTQAVDHVAITGDLTNFATPEEFAAARTWLESLGDPAAITLSPGNHDALVGAGAPIRFAPWTPWLGDGETSFPHLRVRGPVALLNLCSAVPTAWHLAQGRLGATQLAQARTHLRDARDQGLYRVVLIHHPVVPGVVSHRKALTDRAALQALLAEVGAELVLHGHAHEALLTQTPGPSGPIPVIGVPSASTPPGMAHDQAARWNVIDIIRDGGGFRTTITVRGITAARTVEALGRYVLAT